MKPLRVVTVGTGTACISLTRGGACLLLEAEGYTVAVDLGLGALRGLLKAGIRHQELDCLLLTHLHVDHVAEVPSLLFAANYDETPRTGPLALVGGEGFEGYLEGLKLLHGRMVEPKNYALTTSTLKPGEQLDLGPFSVTAGAVSHDPSSLAYRFGWRGRSVAVTGDTGPLESLEPFCSGVDLLVTEASLAEGGEYQRHLTASQAGRLAQKAGVGSLLLTHLYPASEADRPLQRAAENFCGPVSLAHDGMEISLRPLESSPQGSGI